MGNRHKDRKWVDDPRQRKEVGGIMENGVENK